MKLIFRMNALPPSSAAIAAHRVRTQKAFWIWQTSSQVLGAILLFSVYKGWAWVYAFARSQMIAGFDVLFAVILCIIPFVFCSCLNSRAQKLRRELDELLPLDSSETACVDQLASRYGPVDTYRTSAVSARQLVKADLIAMKDYEATTIEHVGRLES